MGNPHPGVVRNDDPNSWHCCSSTMELDTQQLCLEDCACWNWSPSVVMRKWVKTAITLNTEDAVLISSPVLFRQVSSYSKASGRLSNSSNPFTSWMPCCNLRFHHVVHPRNPEKLSEVMKQSTSSNCMVLVHFHKRVASSEPELCCAQMPWTRHSHT